jgi:hypothetical protein
MTTTIFPQMQQIIAGWEGVETASHQFGGVEFRMGKVEIGHVHRNGMVDIPFTRKIRAALVAEDVTQPHHLLADSGWITYYIHNEADMETAVALMRLSYLHKRRQRARNHADFADAIAALPFSAAIKEAAFGASGVE